MRIQAPSSFRHAGQLGPRFAGEDPRRAPFPLQLDIDLRRCQFVNPSAVLWCVIYPLLANMRGSKCRLIVPTENMGVCVYLKSLGLFSVLKNAGVEVDDRGIRSQIDSQVILALTGFKTTRQVEELANQALESLQKSGLGSSNLSPLVSEIFAELALNAVEHSESEIGAFGLIQFIGGQQRFICSVADGGIGIRRSLERNPELRDRVPYDWVAIELALRERVSGTGSQTRGIGLYGISEDMRSAGRQLIVHSGIGMLELSEEIESQSRRTTLFPGTLAFASIPI